MDEKLIITVTPEGEVTVDADGFHGPMCKTTLEDMVSRMGPEKVEYFEKPEFNEVVAENKAYAS